MRPVITRLVERAQASGDLRQDFRATDVKMIAFMLASIAEYAASVTPERMATVPGHAHRRPAPARDGVTDAPGARADRAGPRGPDARPEPAPRAAALKRLAALPHPRSRTCIRTRISWRAFSGALFTCTIGVHRASIDSLPPTPMHVHTHNDRATVHPSMRICHRKGHNAPRLEASTPNLTCGIQQLRNLSDHPGRTTDQAPYKLCGQGRRDRPSFPQGGNITSPGGDKSPKSR